MAAVMVSLPKAVQAKEQDSGQKVVELSPEEKKRREAEQQEILERQRRAAMSGDRMGRYIR
eukprot:CAMPEP_0202864914 /NCGR_PEP_ID=MMETSP1391-20130828/4960_1 /ASSEMBLY_ACC=CAM_ASM_000867 /TAXON_ID=1034604 /ORGANISM="Chlamydomonas leiostraca, Strain SAG 11-49" /LENGTH=60 /DNA_ID=CAMNT_0049544691 /DNA_START=155 /DNA_END=337 /DNA_ORIENTATION=-